MENLKPIDMSLAEAISITEQLLNQHRAIQKLAGVLGVVAKCESMVSEAEKKGKDVLGSLTKEVSIISADKDSLMKERVKLANEFEKEKEMIESKRKILEAELDQLRSYYADLKMTIEIETEEAQTNLIRIKNQQDQAEIAYKKAQKDLENMKKSILELGK